MVKAHRFEQAERRRENGSPTGRDGALANGLVQDNRPEGRAQSGLQVTQLGCLLMIENYRHYQQPGLWWR